LKLLSEGVRGER